MDLLFRHGSGTFSLDHRGQLSLEKALSRRLTFEGDAQIWRVSDPTSLPRVGVARSLSPILYGRTAARARLLVTERWDASVGYRLEAARIYDGSNQPFSMVHAPYLESWYGLNARHALGAELRFQYFRFGDETAMAPGASLAYRLRLTRTTTFTARGGAIRYQSVSDAGEGVIPRVALELSREGESLDLAFVMGHDLVGASGFSSTLWAEYASAMAMWRVMGRFQVFGAASYFRNGLPPNQGVLDFRPGSPGTSQGYALGGGVSWQLHRSLELKGGVDRIAQVGGPELGDLARNIASVRLTYTAL
jgi:hypothetical protein